MNEPVLVIVDDDRDFASEAATLARRRGFATHVAHSVAESVRFAGMPRDLSLLDTDLPDGSGFDVLDRIELDDRGRIVFVTGQPTLESAARAVSMPASDYLTKPLSLEKLDQLLREDLYYRLAGYEISLPPLRDREDDILLLARAFLDEINASNASHRQLDPRCHDALRQYSWPGNVRELRSAIQRAWLMADGDRVSLYPQRGPSLADDDPIVFRVGMTYAEMETTMLVKTLAHFDGDKRAAASALGVSTRTIHNQLARLKPLDAQVDASRPRR
jgi:DNA-binding NtrC family response regulator